jgi:queuine/archaeosine tRNA-ribosyltransferase
VQDAERDEYAIGKGRIAPIVHAPRLPDKTFVSQLLPGLCAAVARTRKPPLLAVPERELGDGLIERARRVRSIRRALDKTGYHQPLHLLGTGNPLSLLVLAQAGADMFDGLEWCRTVVDADTMRLHHFHHSDFFLKQRNRITDQKLVEYMASETEVLTHKAKAILQNLYFFRTFIEELQDAFQRGGVKDLFDQYLPGEYGRVVKALDVDEAK